MKGGGMVSAAAPIAVDATDTARGSPLPPSR